MVPDEYPDLPLFACTDMAQYWHQLGFIVQLRYPGPEPIFVETQRGEILPRSTAVHSPSHGASPALPPKHGGPITLPLPDSPDQNIVTVESLREHLQTAMAIELVTIPLYLFAMYSVNIPDQYVNDPGYHDPVMGAIRGP